MRYKIDKLFTASNMLSFLRLFMAIPFWLMIDEFAGKGNDIFRYYAVVLMILAAVTDLLDGWLARKLNQITELGKIIDPLADKIALTAIIIQFYLYDLISLYYLALLLIRDLSIFTGGMYVTKKIGKVLPSNRLGKITAFTLGCYMIALALDVKSLTWLDNSFIIITVSLSIASIAGYYIRAKESIKWYTHENS